MTNERFTPAILPLALTAGCLLVQPESWPYFLYCYALAGLWLGAQALARRQDARRIGRR